MADVTVEFGATDTGLEKTLKAVQDELTQLKGKVSSGELSMTELESTMKRIGQVTSMEKNIKAIGDSSTATSPKVDALGKDMKTTGDKAEDAGKKGEIGFGKIAIGAGIAGAAAKAGSMVIEAAFAAAQKTVQGFGDALDMGGRLADLSERTGVAVDKVMLLERAFQNTGVGADSLGPILNKMQKAIVDAGAGSSKAADAFTKLGIPLSTLQDLSPDEQLRAIGKAIASIPDPAERAAVSMEIFGKSGGALNQVFANMDGEIETAKAQLGSLPDIMKAGAAQFDKISDNLTIIGGKFVEFAAGIIDKVKPALDALTTALTRIDAAKIGQDFAEFFTGAGEGMKGFQAAVDAIDAGEMGTAFKIVAQAIQLQFKETANSIYANFVAAFQSAGEFLGEIFSPSGALISTVISTFDFLANKISATISRNLANALSGNYLTEGIALQLNVAANEANTAANKIEDSLKGAGGRIAEQFVKTGKSLPDSFAENYAKVPPLFTNLEKHQQEIDRLTQTITKSQGEQTVAVDGTTKAQAAAEQEARKYFDEYQKGQAKISEADKKKAEDQAKINEGKQEELQFQLELAEAQAAGDSERVKALTEGKKLADDFAKAIDAGYDPESAAEFALRIAEAASNSQNIVTTDKDGNPLFFESAKATKSMSENLASATGFAQTLANMKQIEALEKGNNTAKAARLELKAMDQILGTDLAGKSFPDIVKKLNIDKLGMTGSEQIKAVVDYMNGVKTNLSKNPIDSKAGKAAIDEVKNSINKSPFKGKLAMDSSEAKAKTSSAFSKFTTTLDAEKSVKGIRDSVKNGIELDVAAKSSVNGLLDAIKTAVEAIKTAVEKIEPKLPTAALSA